MSSFPSAPNGGESPLARLGHYSMLLQDDASTFTLSGHSNSQARPAVWRHTCVSAVLHRVGLHAARQETRVEEGGTRFTDMASSRP
jgi:hypothetical protein